MINLKTNKQTSIFSAIALVLGVVIASVYWYLNPKVEINEIPVEKIVEKEVVKEVKTYMLPEPLNTETKDWKVYQSDYGFSFRYPEKDVDGIGTYIDRDSEIGKKNPDEPTSIGIQTYKKDDKSYEFPHINIYIGTLPVDNINDIEQLVNMAYKDSLESARNNNKAYRIIDTLATTNKYGANVYTYSHKDGFYTIKEDIFVKNGYLYQVQTAIDDELINKIYSTLIFE